MLNMVKVNRMKTIERWRAVFLNLNTCISNFFIADFEHVFVSWAQDKIHKTAYVHSEKQGSSFKTCTCDISKTTWFESLVNH